LTKEEAAKEAAKDGKASCEEEFKGSKQAHDEGKIPDKICSHYAPGDRAKTADQASKIKPKPKNDKEAKKQENPSYDMP